MRQKITEYFKIDRWAMLTVLFFICYFLVGVAVFRDYGVSIDETAQVNKARITLNYVFGRSDELLTYADRHYGALFPSLLLLGNNFFQDSQEIFFYRHFVTFLFFYLSVIVFYKMMRKLEYSRRFSLLGTILLVFQPTIFAHSFYNPKDIPFLAIFIVSMYSLVRFLKKQTIPNLILHAVVSGLVVVFRLPGIVMWAITAAMFLWLYLARSFTFVGMVLRGLLYVGITFLTLYIFLPTLWAHPISEFATFISMAPFTWSGTELYFGQSYPQDQIPFGHFLVYFIISMPPVLIGFFLVGLIMIAREVFVGKRLFDPVANGSVLAVLSVFVTLEIFLVQRPLVYNGWRHVLFFYPIFLLVVMEGIRLLWIWIGQFSTPWAKGANGLIALVLGGQMLLLGVFIFQSHPYQFTYYNRLAGKDYAEIRQNFEMDYWGLSNRTALENILARDDSPVITITSDEDFPVEQNLLILTKKQRDRLVLLPSESGEGADYFITKYGKTVDLDIPGYQLIDSIKVNGAIINGTYLPIK